MDREAEAAVTGFPKPSKFTRPVRAAYTGLKHAKASRVPDSKFRAHVRGLGCQAKRHSPHKHPQCERTAGTKYSRRVEIHFSPVGTGGTGKAMGRKASDVGGGIGLCAPLAYEQELVGWKTFEMRYDIDAVAIAKELGEAWARKHPN